MMENKLGGFSLCALWFGASVSLAEIMTGSLIAPLGIKTGIAVILIGHLIGTLILSVTGIIGFKERKPALMASRMSMGKYGSYLISLFNIVQLLGWTAIMLIQCARSMQSITSELLGFDNFAVLVIGIGILVAIWALNRDKGISTLNNIAVLLLLVLCLVMLKAIMGQGTIKPIDSTISIGLALELCIVMPLSWVPLISDYTMSGKSLQGSFLGSFVGYFVGSSFMFIIGLLFALYTGLSDPVSSINSLNLGYAALLIVILSTVTTTFLDVYSAVMSTLNLSPTINRTNLILLFSALGTLLALFFPMEQYQNFLYMIGSLFAPAFSVIIADYFLYRADRSGHIFNLPGLIAIVVGIATYYLVLGLDLVIGSTIPSMLVTVLVYAAARSIYAALAPAHLTHDTL
ncbi:MAG TPA: putative hydroxymethylpyrimidine transporter CytX [Syntrophomonas sp.]|jgi:putative hydroxymethylpyrimidine transporter CytX|nr:putative hydroxymethylpyrimidine transporter CytX [Syntrophomonas sp.]